MSPTIGCRLSPHKARLSLTHDVGRKKIHMKIIAMLIILFVVFCSPIMGALIQFELPGVFQSPSQQTIPHGILYIEVPADWDATISYTEAEAATDTMPEIPATPVIGINRGKRTHITVTPMDRAGKIGLTEFYKHYCQDNEGNPVPGVSIVGSSVKGSVYSPPKNHPKNYFRSHGDLESGSLLLTFSTAIEDTNEWTQIQSILESFRFEEKGVQQSGAGHP